MAAGSWDFACPLKKQCIYYLKDSYIKSAISERAPCFNLPIFDPHRPKYTPRKLRTGTQKLGTLGRCFSCSQEPFVSFPCQEILPQFEVVYPIMGFHTWRIIPFSK